MENFLQSFSTYVSTQQFSAFFLLISFLGGVVASLSPCTLGMLPIIVGYVGGYSEEKSLKTAVQMFFFVLGLSLVLTVIGILCAIGGKVFVAAGGTYWVLIMASLILIFGLNLLGVLDIRIPMIVKQMPQNKNNNIFLYPMIIGAMFALASTPCSTPILAAIMSFAALSKNIAIAAVMLFLFSLGQGLIIILAGVFTSFLKNMKSFSKVSNILMKASGVLLILAALYIFYKAFSPYLI